MEPTTRTEAAYGLALVTLATILCLATNEFAGANALPAIGLGLLGAAIAWRNRR